MGNNASKRDLVKDIEKRVCTRRKLQISKDNSFHAILLNHVNLNNEKKKLTGHRYLH